MPAFSSTLPKNVFAMNSAQENNLQCECTKQAVNKCFWSLSPTKLEMKCKQAYVTKNIYFSLPTYTSL